METEKMAESAYTKTETIVQRLRTTNDINGNPRRVWIIYYPGSMPLALDEGDRGTPQQVTAINEYVQLPDISVPPSEYRSFLKQYAPKR
jgi:hypothetical protein